MAQPKPKPYSGGEWTDARFRSFIISNLRRTSMKWKPPREAVKKRFVRRGPNPETGRDCKLHRCDICTHLFPQGKMRADHIEPVVDPEVGFVDWNTYIKRMFLEEEGYQVVCKGCHDVKSAEEREIRKEAKRRLKEKEEEQQKLL